MTLTPELQRLLLQILADTDALFLPYRFDGPLAAGHAIFERRSQYALSGLPMVGGGTDANRKTLERQLTELRRLGLVRVYTGRGRRRGVRLTPAGDDYTRSLVARPIAAEAFPLLAKIEAHPVRDGLLGHACELTLCEQQHELEAQCLPLLARGWIKSNSDSNGVVGYLVTREGRRAKQPELPSDLPEYDPAAGDVYADLLFAALDDRLQWQPEMHAIAIPLSSGLWLSAEQRGS